MSRGLHSLFSYFLVTTLLTVAGLALKPQDAPPWECEDDLPLKPADASNTIAPHPAATPHAEDPQTVRDEELVALSSPASCPEL
ncbi:hypothetical protein [Terriglobus roseus]|uniref:hypothetical protein n=1 Tax=Terriglobus roseus TaxID=392734 RepID=UPI0002DE7F9E|nr:hypothetical protein [Terriglobus roseus]